MVLRTIILKAMTMATGNNASQVERDCLFCNFIIENDPQKILYQDEISVAFADIRPASDHHYLIVPRCHLPSPKELDSSQKSLVEHLIKVGEEILKDKCPPNVNKR